MLLAPTDINPQRIRSMPNHDDPGSEPEPDYAAGAGGSSDCSPLVVRTGIKILTTRRIQELPVLIFG